MIREEDRTVGGQFGVRQAKPGRGGSHTVIDRNFTQQPAGESPDRLLANIFLHEVLDVWFDREVEPRLAGKSALFRYADDAVFLFANATDARRVMAVLAKRRGKYGLEPWCKWL